MQGNDARNSYFCLFRDAPLLETPCSLAVIVVSQTSEKQVDRKMSPEITVSWGCEDFMSCLTQGYHSLKSLQLVDSVMQHLRSDTFRFEIETTCLIKKSEKRQPRRSKLFSM